MRPPGFSLFEISTYYEGSYEVNWLSLIQKENVALLAVYRLVTET